MKMPDNVRYVLDKLNKNSFEAYVVGGCVRDTMRRKEPHDWDITTSAKPEEIMKIFASHKIIPTGLQHGTVTVVVNNKQYEITTFRADGEYVNNRVPETVSFVSSLKDDLKRRDFTINAMAYNPNTGIVDMFGGMADISNGIIRCIGNPDERFQEDALRMLRAVRFATKFGFRIEDRTYDAILRNRNLLENISMERIASELMQTLEYGCSSLLGKLLQTVVPELTGEQCSKLEHKANYMMKNTVIARLVYMFDFEPTKQKEILRRLRLDNRTIEAVVHTTELTNMITDTDMPSELAVRRILNKDETIFHDVISLLKMKSIDNRKLWKLANLIEIDYNTNWHEPYRISQLAVNGDDIRSLGYSGKEIGDVLNELLELAMTQQIPNEHSLLMTQARAINARDRFKKPDRKD